MTTLHIESHSPEATKSTGEHFASEFLRPGVVVALRGDLGSGKTQFTKGVARACGIEENELSSPTFALANEYETFAPLNSSKSFTLFHLDCYRFERPTELLELGLEDYLYPKRGATIIEWAERIEHYLPVPRYDIFFEVQSERVRTITITHIKITPTKQ